MSNLGDRQWRIIALCAGCGTSFLAVSWLHAFLARWQSVVLGVCVGILAAEYVYHRRDLDDERKRRR